MRGVRKEQVAQRQLTSSKGAERMGIRHHEQGTAFPSKGISFFLYLSKYASTSSRVRKNKKELSVQVKIKQRVRIQIMHSLYSWYTSLHGSEQYLS